MDNRDNENYSSMYHMIADNMTDAFAIHKIESDKSHGIKEYLIVEVNRSFENLFNINAEAITDRSVNDILKDQKVLKDSCISIYNEIQFHNRNENIEVYCTDLRRWFLVKQINLNYEYLAIIFADITSQKILKENLSILTGEYETMFNGSQDPVFLIDVEDENKFIYRRLNKAHEKLLGFNTELVKGLTPKELLGDKLGSELEKGYLQCLEMKSTVVYEESLAIDGIQRNWHTVLSPVIKDGKVVNIVGARRDISELKKMEKELAEKEKHYRSLYENNHAIMLLIEPETGYIKDANMAACSFYGYSKDELMKMKISDINILSEDQILTEMDFARNERRNHFIFRHKLSNGDIRDVEVYSGTITVNGTQLLYSIIFDITNRIMAEKALYNEKELFKVTIHSIGDGLLTTDTNGKVTLLNKVAEDITGWTMADAIGKHSYIIMNLKDAGTGKRSEDPIKRILESRKVLQLADNTVLVSKNGIEKNVSDSGAPIIDNDGNIFGTVLVFRDITEDKKRQEEMRYLGQHDSLTGLYNRSMLEYSLRQLDAEQSLPLGIIMGDVNGLKLTNDAFGHEMGDKLLKKIAEIIKSECRKSDIVARIGGDEFVILLPDTNNEEVEKIIYRIIKRCKNEEMDPIKPSVSLGYATKESMEQDIAAVYKLAEDRMYSIKLTESKSTRSSIINSLRKTLNERTHETVEHSERLSVLSKKIGRALKLSADKIHSLRLLALLHDIGITAIPDYILQKSGDLTQDEWTIMRTHCEIGYRIANASPDLSHIAADILSHHENWDGTGYPQGLSGENIPINSRIISILDTYDSMVFGSFYQKAVPETRAVEIIESMAGKQLDPKLVEIFVKVILEL